MKSGYEVIWTENAIKELHRTILYLEQNFTEEILSTLLFKLEYILVLIADNPTFFQKVENFDIYKVVILKFNTMYYSVEGNTILILSFFSNRQNPEEKRL